MNNNLIEAIRKDFALKHSEAVRKCMESPHPLRTAFEEVLKRWDALGNHKDDDFGEVQEAMEVAREVMEKTKS